MSAPLTDEQTKSIESESSTLSSVLDSLRNQRQTRLAKLRTEETRARDLTSQIMNTRREEDRALLASDEAVAHGMRSLQKDESETLEKLIDEPYFGRLIVEEELNGKPKQFEYRIGLRENSECRIIDWRRAPVAKLFYEYREGDEYSEEILGKERLGSVTLRNQLTIKKSELLKVSCKHGTFERPSVDAAWQVSGSGFQSSSSDNTLPEIASLLTADQFSLIENNLERALLIQGVAGSGKTTIAVHRLSWIIGGTAALAQSEKVLAIVLSQSLKNYITKTLPKLGIEGVKIETTQEWFASQICSLFPEYVELHAMRGEFIPRRPDSPCPASIERAKRSLAVLGALEEYVANNPASKNQSATEVVLSVLSDPKQILKHDETGLLSQELLDQVRIRSTANFSAKTLDKVDDPLLVRAYELLKGNVILKDGSYGQFDHVFVDEAQDFSPIELTAVLGSARNLNCVTVVGDTGQKIDSGSVFLGWDKLRKFWSKKEEISKFVTLDLSFRSTIEIRKLADFIRGDKTPADERGRHGRVPIWFKCLSEDRAIRSAQDWLARALDKYPTAVTAVVCRNTTQAREVVSLLRPTFGPLVRLADEAQFSFEAGIVVTDIAQIRGLEFMNLLLWNPGNKDFPNDDQHRNLLYLALSRARENVAIVSWGQTSSLLPGINSTLVRGYDLESEEREELENIAREAKHANRHGQ